MREPGRVTPEKVYERLKSGALLLVCAYEDESKFRQMHLEGAISLNEFKAKPRCCIKMRANQMVVPIKRRFPIFYGYFLKATLGLIQGMTLIRRLSLSG